MKQYLDLMHNVFLNGVLKEDRTGTGTKSLFGQQMRFNLADGFPLVTTKKCHLKSIIHELLWFLQGDTNIRYLKENGVSIWDDWVLEGTAEYKTLSLEERYDLYVVEIKKRLKRYWDSIKAHPDDPLIQMYPPQGALPLDSLLAMGDPGAYLTSMKIPTEILVSGELGPVYGSQWRKWEDVRIVGVSEVEKYDNLGYEFVDTLGNTLMTGKVVVARKIDQIADLIKSLTTNADSRRHMVSAWNPAYVEEQALPPCHSMFQFYTAPLSIVELGNILVQRDDVDHILEPLGPLISLTQETPYWVAIGSVPGFHHPEYYDKLRERFEELGIPTRKLSCQLYQRSADIFLGVPFNIASYALLTMMVAQVTNMVPGDFIWTGGDCHLYTNHLEQAALQLGRAPLPLPTMKINPDVKDLFAFKFEDFELVGYQAHPHIVGKVAV